MELNGLMRWVSLGFKYMTKSKSKSKIKNQKSKEKIPMFKIFKKSIKRDAKEELLLELIQENLRQQQEITNDLKKLFDEEEHTDSN